MDSNLFSQLLNASGVLFNEFSYTREIKTMREEHEEKNQKSLSRIEELENKIKNTSIVGLIIPGIITSILSGIFIIVGTIFVSLGEDDLALLLFYGVCLVQGPILFFSIAGAKKKRINKTKAELAILKNAFRRDKIEKDFDTTIKSLNEQKRAYQQIKLNATSFLPANHRDLYSVCYFLVAIANGRCETLNECVSVMESEGQDLMSLDPDYVKEIKLENINSALYLVKNNKNLLTINSSKIDELEYFDI